MIQKRQRDLSEDIEIRRRVFWGAFVVDKIQSLYQGRPASLQDFDTTRPECQSPVNLLDVPGRAIGFCRQQKHPRTLDVGSLFALGDERSAAWLYAGTAFRMIIDLGMHVDATMPVNLLDVPGRAIGFCRQQKHPRTLDVVSLYLHPSIGR
jgi:hypothetical protein